MRDKKFWAQGVVEVYLEIVDYGVRFDQSNRKDYKIITVTENGEKESIPGLFENKQKARARMKELVGIISRHNHNTCKIGKDSTVAVNYNNSKDELLKERHNLTSKKLCLKHVARMIDNGIWR